MVSSVYWEWELLLISIKVGVKLAFFYDIIRIFRFVLSHKGFLISIEDFVFWLYAGTIIFHLQLEQWDGILRGFSILGMLLGMFLYNKILGERLIFLSEREIKNAKRRLTEHVKLFKIKLCKHSDVFKKYRSSYGRKKNSGKEKEAEQFGNAVGNDGGIGNAVGGSGK